MDACAMACIHISGASSFFTPAVAQDHEKGGLRIDVPVNLRNSRVAFNMDHLAFNGDQSIGLTYMQLMLKNYQVSGARLELVAVFHGAVGYLLLDGAAYNKARKTSRGNPFKEQILDLQKQGVLFEGCGQTARNNGWVNADFIPGVLVNAGANLRLVQLQQDGFIVIHP
ncbi:DsrE family protein [Methylorubrum extorquens]|nr:DsrE family protein [Methylorubrum extorquens]